MYSFVCQQCGASFTSTSRKAKYCSRTCQAQSYKKRITSTCAYCGATFEHPPSHKAKYCSADCFHTAHGINRTGVYYKRVTKVCQQCGREYSIIQSWADTSRFCSRACMGAHKRTIRGEAHPLKKAYVTMTCEMCGKTFDVKPSIAPVKRFCSRQCHGVWTAKHFPHPSSLEVTIADLLTTLGIPFEHNKPVGSFLCDFVLEQYRLVIECDGVYWHNRPFQIVQDRRKNNYLIKCGYSVLRLPEDDIRHNLAACRTRILECVESSDSPPALYGVPQLQMPLF